MLSCMCSHPDYDCLQLSPRLVACDDLGYEKSNTDEAHYFTGIRLEKKEEMFTHTPNMEGGLKIESI